MERGIAARSDLNKLSWEASEFPILCLTCLGDSPYMRMTKADWDKECKICTRPFIVFRWKPNNNSRFKKTEICQTCAKMKNVCQTCLFDLQFGLPVEIRDKYLKEKIEIPLDKVNRDYWAHKMTAKLDTVDLPYNKEGAYPILDKMSRKEPNPKRNLPHICSFFVKGGCSRGNECPYRHDIPEINELSEQNFKERFYGINDPVAKKIMGSYAGNKPPKPVNDLSITSLYISGLTDDSITDKDFTYVFSKFGEIKNVKIMFKKFCAFVTFVERESAEKAINTLYNKLILKGERYRLAWSKINNPENLEEDDEDENKNKIVVNKNEGIKYKTECPTLDNSKLSKTLNPYDYGKKLYYPSMDPKAQGGMLKKKSKRDNKEDENKKDINENNNISLNNRPSSRLEKLREKYADIDE